MEQRFEAKWDTVTKVITVLVLIIIAGSILHLANISRDTGLALTLAVTIFLVLAVFITFITSPLYYAIQDDGILVKRRGGSLHIPFSNIETAERIYSSKELGMGIRLFGSGGFFGYLGVFYYNAIGKVNMNCTDKNSMILLHTKKGYIMISPDKPDAFMQEIKKRIS